MQWSSGDAPTHASVNVSGPWLFFWAAVVGGRMTGFSHDGSSMSKAEQDRVPRSSGNGNVCPK